MCTGLLQSRWETPNSPPALQSQLLLLHIAELISKQEDKGASLAMRSTDIYEGHPPGDRSRRVDASMTDRNCSELTESRQPPVTLLMVPWGLLSLGSQVHPI